MDTTRLGVIALRVFLGGALFLPLATTKLLDYPESSRRLTELFTETPLEHPMLVWPATAVAFLLPFLELACAAVLLAGRPARLSFLLPAATLILLSIATTLMGEMESTARNFVFLIGCAWATADRGDSDFPPSSSPW